MQPFSYRGCLSAKESVPERKPHEWREGFRLAPQEGETYSNKNRCGGQCKLPDSCPRCGQYVCPTCGKVYPWENGGTDSLDCDTCWCKKNPDPQT